MKQMPDQLNLTQSSSSLEYLYLEIDHDCLDLPMDLICSAKIYDNY